MNSQTNQKKEEVKNRQSYIHPHIVILVKIVTVTVTYITKIQIKKIFIDMHETVGILFYPPH